MTTISNIIPQDSLITIIDIGAAVLDDEKVVYQSLIELGRAKLVAFEPDTTALKLLREKFPPPHICLPLIIGDGKAATFYETNWGPTGSIFEPNQALLKKFLGMAEITEVVKTHLIDTVRLDDIPECAGADFIKIDVQGAEKMIFENAEQTLRDVTLIQTEVSWVEVYKGMPLFGDVDRVLRSAGFQFHTRLGSGYRSFSPIFNPDHPHSAFNQELWSDVVYVKDWMKFDQLPPTKLITLAVLLHDLYGSFDLAHQAFVSTDSQAGTNFAENYVKWLADGQ